jgi:hypothetical protein
VLALFFLITQPPAHGHDGLLGEISSPVRIALLQFERLFSLVGLQGDVSIPGGLLIGLPVECQVYPVDPEILALC